MAALTGCGILLVLTTYIGRQPLLVAAAALFCGALVTLLAADDGALQWRVMSGVQVAAAWLLGHSALAPLNGGTLGLALLMGLAAYARLLAGSRPLAARRILTWAWIILVVASIQGRQPVVTAAVAVGGIAERMQGGQRAARSGGRWLSQFQQWAPWLAATALTALAATHWG